MLGKLIGRWKIDPRDSRSIDTFGNTILEFKEDGSLIYTVKEASKDQIMILTYELDQDTLVTNQESWPQKEKTDIVSLTDRMMILKFDGITSTYFKED
jgi:hypothetical protein